MHQTRLNWCVILHVHSEETDKLDLMAVVLLNTVNYSTVVDQSDYSISTILYNNNYKYSTNTVI